MYALLKSANDFLSKLKGIFSHSFQPIVIPNTWMLIAISGFGDKVIHSLHLILQVFIIILADHNVK